LKQILISHRGAGIFDSWPERGRSPIGSYAANF
jgi:hypothetical protein